MPRATGPTSPPVWPSCSSAPSRSTRTASLPRGAAAAAALSRGADLLREMKRRAVRLLHADGIAVAERLGESQADVAVGVERVADDLGALVIVAGRDSAHHDVGIGQINHAVDVECRARPPFIADVAGLSGILIKRDALPGIVRAQRRRQRQGAALAVAVRKVDRL